MLTPEGFADGTWREKGCLVLSEENWQKNQKQFSHVKPLLIIAFFPLSLSGSSRKWYEGVTDSFDGEVLGEGGSEEMGAVIAGFGELGALVLQ